MNDVSEAMLEQCDEAARVLKALAHPQRLQILCHLAEAERTVGELERLCEASQSLVSQFLARMKAEGLVASRREGQYVKYEVADPKVHKLLRAMQKIFCPS